MLKVDLFVQIYGYQQLKLARIFLKILNKPWYIKTWEPMFINIQEYVDQKIKLSSLRGLEYAECIPCMSWVWL